MKTTIKIYIGITLLLITDLICYLSMKISLSGNLSDRALFWIWLIATVIIVPYGLKNRWAKIYGAILIVLALLSMFPMGVPILTVYAFAVDQEYSIRLDNGLRLAETTDSVIDMPYIAVIQNYWIFEKEIGETEFHFEINQQHYRLQDAKSIKFLSTQSDNEIQLEFQFQNGNVIRTLLKHGTS